MPYLGNITDFKPEEEDFQVYVERVKLFFSVNDIAESKKAQVFLTLIGAKNYATLRDLVHLSESTSKTFQLLVDMLQGHFSPTRNMIAEGIRVARKPLLSI